MIYVEDNKGITNIIRGWRQNNEIIGLVPTMGCFHRGHLSLMEESVANADKTVVSLFVNPLQFSPAEDLDSYPRDLQQDMQLAEKIGVDVLFSPKIDIMYPQGYQTNVSVQKLSSGLCGESRPGHFEGVATVVTKLFNLVQPDIAVFGRKDYQQLAIIRQLTKDLNYNIDIIGHPIVRESDGMAMSSRNKYLNTEGRKKGLCLFNALEYAKKKMSSAHATLKSSDLIKELFSIIEEAPGCKVDYISIVDKDTLATTTKAEKGNVLALAVFIDNSVRLIDNTVL